MSYEIDHLFICASVGAPEADQLVNFGLTEGSSNRHKGQGTENRRFFFHNAMLELLWVSDPAEARSARTQRTELWDRWVGREQSSSPFGACLRPAVPGNTAPPFSSWDYCPPFLPAGLMIQVGEDVPLTEPMWFFLAFGQRPDAIDATRREPLEHKIGIREVTGVHICTPTVTEPSLATQKAVQTGLVNMTTGRRHLLELTFDGGEGGYEQDFRPDLPLLVRW